MKSVAIVLLLATASHANAFTNPITKLLKNAEGKPNGANGTVCPPPGFDSVQKFNISTFVSAPWFVQEQMPVSYQPVNELYCVRASYSLLDAANPLAGLEVRNYANRGSVNGPSQGSSGAGSRNFGRLVAKVPNPTETSKLEVGFALPGTNRPIGAGPYWVVAVEKDYQWAIITGGEPKVATAGGCMTGSPGRSFLPQVNGVGFWLFSRTPVDPPGTAAMRAKAAQLGLDLSPLVPVAQAGCTYAGA